jgi:hypothetical protein
MAKTVATEAEKTTVAIFKSEHNLLYLMHYISRCI